MKLNNTYWRDCAALFGIFVFIYFPMLVFLPLSIDAEVTILTPNHNYWLSSERWASYLIANVFPPHLVPYFMLAIFGVCASIAYRLLLSACKVAADWRAFVGFPIFVGYPVWMFILEFSVNVAPTGIALMLCCLALLSMVERVESGRLPPVAALGEVALLTFAFSCYQAFAFVFVTLLVGWFLVVSYEPKKRGRIIVQSVIIWSAACALAYSIGKGVNYALGIKTVYVDQFIRVDQIASLPLTVVHNTFQTMLNTLSGAPSVYGMAVYSSAVVIVIALLAVVIKRSMWHLFLLACLLIAPFGFVILAGGANFPLRGLLGIPVAMWAMAMLSLRGRR